MEGIERNKGNIIRDKFLKAMLTKMVSEKRVPLLIFLVILIVFCTWYLKYPFIHSPKVNIILITVDSLRPDHLGCYGYKRNTSPNIDKVAQKSILFTQAIAQGSKTPLSLSSLHTSTYPRTHGVYREGFKINPSLPTLAEILKKNGYVTAAIVSCVKYIQGLERGFDYFIDNGNTPADWVTQEAIFWLDKNRNNKSFLWIHYFDPHGPYKSPTPYNRMFKEMMGNKKLPISNDLYSGFLSIPLYVAEDNITDVDYYISQYDGEIRFVDEQIGVLLGKLKELNLYKNSILIITADHGEAMGEHDHYFEHWSVYDEIIKIPLLFRWEKIIPLTNTINNQVQCIDIAPTILDILYIHKPKTMQGMSLLPLILNKKKHPSMVAFSENARPSDWIRECIRTNEWKLIYTKQKNTEIFELFDLGFDKMEKNDVYKMKEKEFRFLRKLLQQWRQRIPETKPQQCDNLTEETKSLLKNLGYMQ